VKLVDFRVLAIPIPNPKKLTFLPEQPGYVRWKMVGFYEAWEVGWIFGAQERGWRNCGGRDWKMND